jgi:hypothetical protein
MVATMSWFFSVDSISSMVLAGFRSVARRVVRSDTRMPADVINKGYDIAVHECELPSDETEDTCGKCVSQGV